MPDDFLVDSIFRKYEIHLIFGPISEECTMLALSIAAEWSAGRPVFGSPSHPAPFVYVACEATAPVLRGLMADMHLDPSQIPSTSLVGRTRPDEHNVETALAHARQVDPQVRVLFLDGMLSLCTGRVNDYKESAKFLRDTVALCQRERVTIIGCVSTSKSKDGAGYLSTRDRMHGSTAWSSSSQTKILIEPNYPRNDTDITRTVSLMAPARRVIKFQYELSDTEGLILTGDGPMRASMDGWLAVQPNDTEITTQQFIQVAQGFDIGHATVERWLRQQLELGTLTKVKHGVYRVIQITLS